MPVFQMRLCYQAIPILRSFSPLILPSNFEAMNSTLSSIHNRPSKIQRPLILAAVLALVGAPAARADWLDLNGTTSGYGVADTGSYDWLAANAWAATFGGTTAGATWVDGTRHAYFIGAGSGTTYTVRLGGGGSSNVTLGNFAINSDGVSSSAGLGNVTIGNVGDTGILTLNANNSVGAQGSGTLTINNPLALNAKTLNYRGGNVVLNGEVSGTGNLVLDNDFGTFGLSSGTLTLRGTNIYTANTDVRSGTLNIGGSGSTGSVSSGSVLVLSRTGVVSLTRTDNFTQVFASTTLNAGAPMLTATTGNTLDLAVLTRNVGGTIDINTVGTIKTKTANTATSILGGWATAAGVDWAVSAGDGTTSGAISALGSYTDDTWAVGNNTTVTASSSPSSGSTTNSVRFNAAGAYTLTLAGINTITSGGILVTSNVGNNLSKITGGTLLGANGKDLVVHQNNSSNGLTIESIVADNTTASGLTKSGSGTVTLTANNTYTGGTFVNGGTLELSGTSQSGGSIFINRGALLECKASTTTAFSATAATSISGGGTIRFNGPIGWGGGANPAIVTIAMYAGAMIDVQSGSFNGGANSNKVYTNNFASLNVASGATFGTSNVGVRMDALTGLGNINNSSSNTGGSFTFGVANGSGTFGGVLQTTASNKFAFTKTGSGTQTLSGPNTYTSIMNVNGGVLAISGSGTLGVATGGLNGVTLGGGQLDLGGTSQSVGAVSVTAAYGSGDTIRNGSLTGTSYAASNGSGTAVISANLLANGSAGFAKSGNGGAVTLTGVNTYTGGTTITAGRLNLNHTGDSNPAIVGNVSMTTASASFRPVLFLLADNQLASTASVSGSISGASNTSYTEFVLGGRSQTIAGYVGTGAIGLGSNIIENDITGGSVGGTGVLTINNTSSVELGSASNRVTLRDGGSGKLAIVKDGSGTLSINLYTGGVFATTSYTGGFTLKNGTVHVAGEAFYNNTLTLQGGTLSSDSATARAFLSNAVSLDGNVTLGNTTNNGVLSFGGTATLTGNRELTIASDVTFASSLGQSASGYGLTKAGAGTLTLSGTTTYTGNTTVNQGVLKLGNGTVNTDLANASTLTIAAGASVELAFSANPLDNDTIQSLYLGTPAVQVPAGTYNASHPTYGSYFAGTGSLTVSSGPAPSSAYDLWATGAPYNLTGPDAAFDADPDGDGLDNGLEWILGGDPTSGTSSPVPTATTDGLGNLTLTFTRLEASIGETTLALEYDTDLVDAFANTFTIDADGGTDANGVTVSIDQGATPDEVTVIIPAALAPDGSMFTRLKATN